MSRFLVVVSLALSLVGCGGQGSAASSPAASQLALAQPGELRILAPLNGSTVETKSVSFVGVAPVGATVVRDIGFAPDESVVATDGTWSMTVDLGEGPNSLTFRIGDDKATATTIDITYAPSTAVITPAPTPEATAEPTAEPTAQPTAEPVAAAPQLTAEQENAFGTAEDYLAYTAFSRSGLISQLKFEGYSKAAATFAVDHVTVNWKEQAYLKAMEYLDYTHFSRSGLISQLKYEGFSAKEATYGVTKAGL